MLELKSPSEIEEITLGGRIIGALHDELEERVRPGVSTGDLDAFAEEFIRSHDGAVPIFKGLYGFPGAVCISVNEEIVHGIPSSSRRLREGDIVTVDVGVKREGWCSDSARTFRVGRVSSETEQLLEVTRRALEAAIAQATPGNRVGDIGAAVMGTVEGTGFHIIRDLVGHGIGRKVHEDPQVPNLGRAGEGTPLHEGLVVAIEPMIAVGTDRIETLDDGWTVVTRDRSLSAHYEHTVAVTADGPRVLTATVEQAAGSGYNS